MRTPWRPFAAILLAAILLPAADGSADAGVRGGSPAVNAPPAPTLGAPEAPFPLARPSILIEGDAGFLSPLSGVRSGSGTPSDPYVISDHTLLHDRTAALRMIGTRAHTVIENVYVPRSMGHAGAASECAVGTGDPLCRASVAIELDDAQNVTLRRVTIDYDVYGIRLSNAEKVALQNVSIGDGLDTPLRPVVALLVLTSHDVDVEGLRVKGASFPFHVWQSERVRIHHAVLDGTDSDGHAVDITSSRDVELSSSTLLEVTVRLRGVSERVAIVGNLMQGRTAQIEGDLGRANDLFACGNTIQGSSMAGAIYLIGGERPIVRGNRIEGNDRGMLIVTDSFADVAGNVISGSAEYGLWLVSLAPMRLFQNSFFDNAEGVFIPLAVDARGNWWGDASGPSGVGPGGGDPLVTDGAPVEFAPWLASAPEPWTCER